MFVQGIGKNCTRTFLREKFEIFGDIEETKVFFREDKYVLSIVYEYADVDQAMWKRVN